MPGPQLERSETGETHSFYFSADTIGFLGVGLILLAFFLNIFGWMDREGLAYTLINLFGAGLAFLSSYLIDSKPFMILEATWAVVSLVALVNWFRRR